MPPILNHVKDERERDDSEKIINRNLFAPTPKVQDTTDNPIKAADEVLEEYIQYKVNYNEFLLDGANKFSPLELQNLDLVSVIERFDSTKFLHAHAKKFPTICLLTRSLMVRFSNNGFQESVFWLRAMQWALSNAGWRSATLKSVLFLQTKRNYYVKVCSKILCSDNEFNTHSLVIIIECSKITSLPGILL